MTGHQHRLVLDFSTREIRNHIVGLHHAVMLCSQGEADPNALAVVCDAMQPGGVLIKVLSKAESRVAGFKPLPVAEQGGISISRCAKQMRAGMDSGEARSIFEKWRVQVCPPSLCQRSSQLRS